MPGPFTPADNYVGPIVHALATNITTQIPSIAKVYEQLPDTSPIDNSVLIPLTSADIKEETNGKMRVTLNFGIRHVFKRKSMSSNVTYAYTYVQPWLLLLSAWPNLTLGGLAREVTTTKMRVTQVTESGQVMVALVTEIMVLTEFNIPLT